MKTLDLSLKIQKHRLFNRPYWSTGEVQVVATEALREGLLLSKDDLSLQNLFYRLLVPVDPSKSINPNYVFNSDPVFDEPKKGNYDVLFYKGDIFSLKFFSKGRKTDEIYLNLGDGSYPERTKNRYSTACQKTQSSNFDFVLVKLEKMGDARIRTLEKNRKCKMAWEFAVDNTKNNLEKIDVRFLNHVDLFPGFKDLLGLYQEGCKKPTRKYSSVPFNSFKDLDEVYEIQFFCKLGVFMSWKSLLEEFRTAREYRLNLLQESLLKWALDYSSFKASTPFKEDL